MSKTAAELSASITDYLAGGGLFNPEMATHEAVRDLLIDCRAALDATPGWMPMATVPRLALGGQILTFRNYGGLEASFPAKRGQHGPWFQTSFWSEKHGLWVGWPLNVQPTHWMPLPAAPALDQP